MKLCKYYSLDECQNTDVVIKKLEDMQDDSKVEYSMLESDVIKIKSIALLVKERKDLVNFFRENDVIDYPDYEEYYEDDIEDEDEDDEDDYEY